MLRRIDPVVVGAVVVALLGGGVVVYGLADDDSQPLSRDVPSPPESSVTSTAADEQAAAGPFAPPPVLNNSPNPTRATTCALIDQLIAGVNDGAYASHYFMVFVGHAFTVRQEAVSAASELTRGAGGPGDVNMPDYEFLQGLELIWRQVDATDHDADVNDGDVVRYAAIVNALARMCNPGSQQIIFENLPRVPTPS